MSRFLILILPFLLLAGALSAEPAPVPDTRLAALVPEAVKPLPRTLPAAAGERRCTADGRHCIALATYVRDVCRTIEATAREAGLDPHFFARLLWKESLFDATAVSPKGAQGIAQFMPGTAELRDLADPFNPAEALRASARYLAELAGSLGNIGLAAVAYNGGEARAARFMSRTSGLPAETRDYVQAITGHPAETWRDAPPEKVDLALAREEAFEAACIRQAEGRSIREFKTGPVVLPWGAVVATNRDRTGAQRQVARLKNRLGPVLAAENVAYVRERRQGLRGVMWFAQVGRETREEAEAYCARVRGAGGDCMVLKN